MGLNQLSAPEGETEMFISLQTVVSGIVFLPEPY